MGKTVTQLQQKGQKIYQELDLFACISTILVYNISYD
jgi:hypothetical protein